MVWGGCCEVTLVVFVLLVIDISQDAMKSKSWKLGLFVMGYMVFYPSIVNRSWLNLTIWRLLIFFVFSLWTLLRSLYYVRRQYQSFRSWAISHSLICVDVTMCACTFTCFKGVGRGITFFSSLHTIP